MTPNKPGGNASNTIPDNRPSPVSAWNLPSQSESITNQSTDFVENFCQVTTGLSLQHDGGSKESNVHIGNSTSHRLERLIQWNP